MAIDLKNKNFARSALAAGINDVASQLTVTTGHGAKFPATGNFHMVIWSASYATPTDDSGAEIVLATLNADDTFDITRAQDNTAASAHAEADNVALVITAGKIDELETEITTRDMTGQVTAATTSAAGKVELATNAECITGTDTARAVTPDGLTDVLDGRTKAKNAIINGAFDVWQRGTTFAAASNIFTADRFSYNESADGAVTVLLDTDVPTAAEFGGQLSYSLKVDCTTADATIGSAQYAYLEQRIEGFNYRPFVTNYGTLTFWVKSNLTGTFVVAFVNNGNDRSYVAEYTINDANTWEKKTITVLFNETDGTWAYTTGVGLKVQWTLAAGSGWETTANAWQSGNYRSTSNQANFLSSTDNNFWLTGVQFELGQVATPFEFENIGITIRKCQRYFEKSYDIGTAVGTSTATGAFAWHAVTTQDYVLVQFQVAKRVASATVVFYSTADGEAGHIRCVTEATNLATNAAQSTGTQGFQEYQSEACSAASHLKMFQWTADAEL